MVDYASNSFEQLPLFRTELRRRGLFLSPCISCLVSCGVSWVRMSLWTSLAPLCRRKNQPPGAGEGNSVSILFLWPKRVLTPLIHRKPKETQVSTSRRLPMVESTLGKEWRVNLLSLSAKRALLLTTQAVSDVNRMAQTHPKSQGRKEHPLDTGDVVWQVPVCGLRRETGTLLNTKEEKKLWLIDHHSF